MIIHDSYEYKKLIHDAYEWTGSTYSINKDLHSGLDILERVSSRPQLPHFSKIMSHIPHISRTCNSPNVWKHSRIARTNTQPPRVSTAVIILNNIQISWLKLEGRLTTLGRIKIRVTFPAEILLSCKNLMLFFPAHIYIVIYIYIFPF